MTQIKLGQHYQHKNGACYLTQSFCRIKHQGVWYSGVSYRRYASLAGELYVRTIEDFLENFTEVM